MGCNRSIVNELKSSVTGKPLQQNGGRMKLDLNRLADRSLSYALAGAVAIVIGWVILAQTFGDARGAPSTAGVLFGWGIVALGGMAIQAAIVGLLFAGSTRDKLPGDDGVVMRD